MPNWRMHKATAFLHKGDKNCSKLQRPSVTIPTPPSAKRSNESSGLHPGSMNEMREYRSPFNGACRVQVICLPVQQDTLGSKPAREVERSAIKAPPVVNWRIRATPKRPIGL